MQKIALIRGIKGQDGAYMAKHLIKNQESLTVLSPFNFSIILKLYKISSPQKQFHNPIGKEWGYALKFPHMISSFTEQFSVTPLIKKSQSWSIFYDLYRNYPNLMRGVFVTFLQYLETKQKTSWPIFFVITEQSMGRS